MAPRLPEEVKSLIATMYFEQGRTMQEIARDLVCGYGTVQRVVKCVKEFGATSNPVKSKPGLPSVLDPVDCGYIKDLLTENPSMYLDEIQEHLLEDRDVDVSISTISRALRHLNMTRKTLTKASAERDEELRQLWEVDMAQYDDPELFVAIDESAVDNKTGQRGSGWAEINTRCVRRMTFLRGIRYSILPALTVDGIIALEIIEGSITKDIFLKFLREQVAPTLNPYPGKRSVVLLDNCSIHHDEDIRQLIVDECGARLIYLPPYSPDFNPIEEAFSAIKAFLRREEANFTSPDQIPWLVTQAVASVSAEDALGWFYDCGYL
ncbi:hypothetical protein NMY22_g18348 [Coprinellus aureogranulatus]|nr:hypothetical protein NMY22_g18348 [Coprinellus aureogranulatus]